MQRFEERLMRITVGIPKKENDEVANYKQFQMDIASVGARHQRFVYNISILHKI